MQLNDIDDFLVIPPIYRISNQLHLREKRRQNLLSREQKAIRFREAEQAAGQSEAERNSAERTATSDTAAIANLQTATFQEREAALEAVLDAERRQLQQLQNAAAVAPPQMAQENSMTVMADILLQMADLIQNMIDASKHDETNAPSTGAPFPIADTIPRRGIEDVAAGALSPEAALKQHLENLALLVRRNAETAYHVRQSPISRPDATPVVPPLHHEDEYL